MAALVLACGTSHTPLLALSPDEWEARARNDRENAHLTDRRGVVRSYDELLALEGPRYAADAVPERWAEHARDAQLALDRLAEDIAASEPDVLVIIGDDEHELFSAANMPAIGIFYGDTAISREFAPAHDPRIADPAYAWMQTVARGYGMDRNRSHPVAAEFARGLIEHTVASAFDVAALASVPNPEKRGFGHAYGFVQTRLLGGRQIPIVPVLLNTYYPPNQPTPARCYDFGVALRAAIDAADASLRVAVIASGGLSHFVTNDDLDRSVLSALEHGDAAALRGVPKQLLDSGSSEIRNWIALGGVLRGAQPGWSRYMPVYRTPAGTGVGLAFASWGLVPRHAAQRSDLHDSISVQR